MILLTNKDYESYINQTSCQICKKSLKINTLLIKVLVKLGTIVNIQVNTEVLHIAYVIWNIVYLKTFLYKESNCDYYLVIEKLAKEFEEEFVCVRKKTDFFFSSNNKRTYRIDKNRKEISKTISCKIKFFDRARFMGSSLPNLVDILLKEFIK